MSTVSNTKLIEETVASIRGQAAAGVGDSARQRWDSLTKPRGSLGRLESAVVQLCEIQQTVSPRIDRRAMYVFCGDHGITAEGVSLYPSVVTREMVKNFLRGGAAINVLCREHRITTHIIDCGVAGAAIEGTIDRRIGAGTRNFLREPAMSKDEAAAAIANGIALARGAANEFDIAGVGEMGIGNSSSASALLCAFTGATPDEAAGRGTGLDDEGLTHKKNVIGEALRRARCNDAQPLAVAAELGGFEIATMAGFLLGAAAAALPVVVDGFISGSAYLVARGFYPPLARHVFFSHRSAERGHSRLLEATGAAPLLDLEMRLGEGTGAALAIALLVSAVCLYRDMATFAEASVSDIAPAKLTEAAQ